MNKVLFSGQLLDGTVDLSVAYTDGKLVISATASPKTALDLLKAKENNAIVTAVIGFLETALAMT